MATAIMYSGGKDSTATVILAYEHNIPIDYILMAEVMFDHKRGISGENPEHIKWVYEVAIPKFEEWGYKVKVVKSTEDYLYWFFKTRGNRCKRPEYNGKRYGWFMKGMCIGNDRLKISPLHKAEKELGITQKIVGIALDEPIRLERAKGKGQRSLLAEYGYTEQMALELCEKHNLLSPIYQHFFRGGCWFCPNATIKEYAFIKRQYPILWEELRKLDRYFQSHKDEFVWQKVGFRFTKQFGEIDKAVDDYLIKQETALF